MNTQLQNEKDRCYNNGKLYEIETHERRDQLCLYVRKAFKKVEACRGRKCFCSTVMANQTNPGRKQK